MARSSAAKISGVDEPKGILHLPFAFFCRRIMELDITEVERLIALEAKGQKRDKVLVRLVQRGTTAWRAAKMAELGLVD